MRGLGWVLPAGSKSAKKAEPVAQKKLEQKSDAEVTWAEPLMMADRISELAFEIGEDSDCKPALMGLAIAWLAQARVLRKINSEKLSCRLACHNGTELPDLASLQGDLLSFRQWFQPEDLTKGVLDSFLGRALFKKEELDSCRCYGDKEKLESEVYLHHLFGLRDGHLAMQQLSVRQTIEFSLPSHVPKSPDQLEPLLERFRRHYGSGNKEVTTKIDGGRTIMVAESECFISRQSGAYVIREGFRRYSPQFDFEKFGSLLKDIWREF